MKGISSVSVTLYLCFAGPPGSIEKLKIACRCPPRPSMSLQRVERIALIAFHQSGLSTVTPPQQVALKF